MQLVDNAISFTPPGGRIDLSVSTDNGIITLMVEDSGPGIPEEAERERVFDPFYRILGSDKIGSRLGLSIVQTISARIGAKVSLYFANVQSGLCVIVAFRLGKKLSKPCWIDNKSLSTLFALKVLYTR